jgi:hypothetical protein
MADGVAGSVFFLFLLIVSRCIEYFACFFVPRHRSTEMEEAQPTNPATQQRNGTTSGGGLTDGVMHE